MREVLIWGLLTAISLPRRTKMDSLRKKSGNHFKKLRGKPNQKKEILMGEVGE